MIGTGGIVRIVYVHLEENWLDARMLKKLKDVESGATWKEALRKINEEENGLSKEENDSGCCERGGFSGLDGGQ